MGLGIFWILGEGQGSEALEGPLASDREWAQLGMTAIMPRCRRTGLLMHYY